MRSSKVIIDFSGYSDSELDEKASTVIKGCTGNTAFTFTGNALANATTAQDDYHKKLAAIATGNASAVPVKEAAKKVLIDSLRILCTQINLLANGDLVKLTSTGAPLTKQPSGEVLPMPTNLLVKYNDVSGSIKISVDKPNVTDHGTMFAYALASSAVDDINEWKIQHSNGHSMNIKGLQPGQNYKFAAAYKGLDEDDLIWCAPITKMVV